jgi:hypothetical protein
VTERRYAQPGDLDLDLDIDGVTITAVVVEGREILLRITGGFGSWVNTDGGIDTFEPGEDGVEEGECRMRLPDMTDEGFDAYVARLYRWRDGSIPLRLVGSPNRMFTLIEDRKTWLPMPRPRRGGA